MTREQIAVMAWDEWTDLRRFADWRLGIKGEDDDGEVTEFG